MKNIVMYSHLSTVPPSLSVSHMFCLYLRSTKFLRGIVTVGLLIMSGLLPACSTLNSLAWWRHKPRSSVGAKQPALPRLTISPEDLPADSLLGDYDLASYPRIDSPWVDSVLSTLSLRDRVAQMVVPFTFCDVQGKKRSELKSFITNEHVGGVIISKGSLDDARTLIDSMQSWTKIPLLISADFENGLSMRLKGTTEFPSMMALGATRNPDLAYAMGRAIADEASAIGVHQNYAPVCDVNNNPLNPIINVRSFGESPELVATMAEAYARGLQDGKVVATAKHFPGHGDTENDSHSFLPVLPFTASRLDSIELLPFKRLIGSGVLSLMLGHLAVPALDPDGTRPATVSPYLLDSLLRQVLDFKGLIVTDAMNMKAFETRYPNGRAAQEAVRAGADVLLMPNDITIAIDSVIQAVKRGELFEAEINRSVRRILSYKQWLGLASHNLARTDSASIRTVATPAHAELARHIALSAVTLVKNDSSLLPLHTPFAYDAVCVSFLHSRDDVDAGALMAVLRPRFEKLRTFSIERKAKPAERQRVLDSLTKADLVIIASFINVREATGLITLSDEQAQFAAELQKLGKHVVLLSFGSPYVLSGMPWVQSYIAAYGSDTPSLEAMGEILFADAQPHGNLPVTIPGLAVRGTGLRYQTRHDPSEEIPLPEILASSFSNVDSLIESQIAMRSFPGAQLYVWKNGAAVHVRNYGTLTYDSASPPVTSTTLYDLASLTKVVATTSAAMKLYEEGRLDLDATVATYIPAFAQNGKAHVTIRNLLLHNSGLAAFHQYYNVVKNGKELLDSLYDEPLDYPTGTKMVYSDLGVITLAKVIEHIADMTLDNYVQHAFFEPLGMKYTMFTPPDSLRSLCAPTELDTVWRHRLIQGTVHDERAALLDGVAGHAGLFSNASDLAIFSRMMLGQGQLDSMRLLHAITIDMFTKRQTAGNSRALGWDTKSSVGSSAGRYFSSRSYGHTGFTGTSIWIDPEADMFVVFLTNRVYPTRENRKLISFRHVLHDAVREAISEMETN